METLTQHQNTTIPMGAIKTFGKYGNPYIVLDKSEQDADGKTWVEIKLLETDRKDYYPLDAILLDPEAE
ncbi:DUF5397 family protein [Faucicola mancuniensis]|uniref:DUF5397 family protein n=1 Tax=Faucicola mancuniensis TaxID=1309795 RepID=UPI0028E2EAD0|nr:DUF5397 family protein [uncultured Moraxella sp.]